MLMPSLYAVSNYGHNLTNEKNPQAKTCGFFVAQNSFMA
jgi:hypothetical protein